MSKSFEQEMEENQAYLERERELWLHHKARDERAEGWDGEAKKLRKESMAHLNTLLEEKFNHMVVLEALANVPA